MTGGPWTQSMKVVHGPLVHVLSSPLEISGRTQIEYRKINDYLSNFSAERLSADVF